MNHRITSLALAVALLTLSSPQRLDASANSAVDASRSTIRWSPQELAYLQSRPPIRMCVAPDWMPIEGIDRNGQYTGMAADYIRLMQRRGGLNIELVRTRSWDESWRLGQQGRCDIFSLLMDAPSRRSFLDFTTPYLEIPGVIATSVHVPFVDGLEQVRGKRLGHMRGFAGIELLHRKYPDIQLIGVDSYEEGLEKVQNGELFGFIGNMMSIGYILQQNKMYDVKIAGRIHDDNLMSVATRKDQPMLHQVFQRLVDSITPEERQAISNRWLAVRFEQGFDYRRLWEILGVFALIGVVTAFWATKLRRVNRELRVANERLAEITRHDALTGLFNRLHFDEIVEKTVSLCARHRLTMTVAMIDLDHFKTINDTFGHPFGDACLRHVAALLQKCFRRDTDTAIRYGGEELMVISVGGTPEAIVERLDEFRREVARSVVRVEEKQSSLTLSIGVWSGVPDLKEEAAHLLKLADSAMYDAKKLGRNRVVVAQDSLVAT